MSAQHQITIKTPANYLDTVYFYSNFSLVYHLQPKKWLAKDDGYDPSEFVGKEKYPQSVGYFLCKLLYPVGTPGVLEITISRYQLTIVYAHGFKKKEIIDAVKEHFFEAYGKCDFVDEN